MTKLIGLVVVTNHNFGSILQTYALQRVVRRMGASTQIIKYAEGATSKICRFRNIEYATSRLKMIYKRLAISLRHSRRKSQLSERANAFREFINKELSFSELYTSLDSLSEAAKKYDIVLLGSDQVWHPMNPIMNFFTLNFVPENIKKGAYAPSFGVSSIPESYKKTYAHYINRIDYVSSRELTGVKIIKELTNRDVPMVCDPTLLLTESEWEECLSDKVRIEEKYVFCYFIGNNPNQRNLVKQYARKNNLKIVALLHIDEFIESDENYADYAPYNVGPAEFLYLLKNAECIMTDSFHASVFSLQFHRPFYTFNRFENGKGNSTSSRIDSLLSTVGLLDRKVSNGATFEDLSTNAINFSDVNERMEKFRAFSLNYLKSIVG